MQLSTHERHRAHKRMGFKRIDTVTCSARLSLSLKKRHRSIFCTAPKSKGDYTAHIKPPRWNGDLRHYENVFHIRALTLSRRELDEALENRTDNICKLLRGPDNYNVGRLTVDGHILLMDDDLQKLYLFEADVHL